MFNEDVTIIIKGFHDVVKKVGFERIAKRKSIAVNDKTHKNQCNVLLIVVCPTFLVKAKESRDRGTQSPPCG